nr:MAG TPA: DNA-directed RNA polymerase subunit alpha [Caudoviricetes sp.]
MEVLLSINHFRAMLPEELQNAPYEVRRQWLVDHDLIKGIKSEKYWDLTDEQKQLKSILDQKVEELNFSVRLLNTLKTHDVVNVKDLIDKHDEYKKYLGKKLSEEISDFLDNLNLDFNTDTEIKANVVYSNPEATGIGYRIPTQGMSSMFAFIAADVLPETSGDLIIVPREFTAQTGSDFDIDKLFIAMKSYTNGI